MCSMLAGLLCFLHAVYVLDFFFFFKQKTAYEMRISDWSSDVCSSDLFDFDTGATLYSILGTEISPELVPADADGAIQSTQDMIGPNELHDFFLHYVVRKGMGTTKIDFLAWKAWGNDKLGEWPVGLDRKSTRLKSRH